MVPLGIFSIDTSKMDWSNLDLAINGRVWTERLLYDRDIATWKANIRNDEATILAWGLGNVPAGLTAIEPYAQTLPVFAPSGKQLRTISVLEPPANVAWGGRDGKTLYITARTSVYKIKLDVGGKPPATIK